MSVIDEICYRQYQAVAVLVAAAVVAAVMALVVVALAVVWVSLRMIPC